MTKLIKETRYGQTATNDLKETIEYVNTILEKVQKELDKANSTTKMKEFFTAIAWANNYLTDISADVAKMVGTMQQNQVEAMNAFVWENN